VGTTPEHIMTTPKGQDEPVTWIGRDRTRERVPEPESHVTPTPAEAVRSPRWMWTVGALVVALLIALVAWRLMSANARSHTTLAERGGIPLITVIVPGQQAVSASVSFTGAIAARYDMPIANEGDTGRIVGIYVEAGDHVKRGQLLAKIDDSVLVQQVNRL
jgi:multidrug efflux pump subunit AcrA (membrane-fusion protein)